MYNKPSFCTVAEGRTNFYNLKKPFFIFLNAYLKLCWIFFYMFMIFMIQYESYLSCVFLAPSTTTQQERWMGMAGGIWWQCGSRSPHPWSVLGQIFFEASALIGLELPRRLWRWWLSMFQPRTAQYAPFPSQVHWGFQGKCRSMASWRYVKSKPVRRPKIYEQIWRFSWEFQTLYPDSSWFILIYHIFHILTYLDKFIISWFILISLDFFSLQIWSAMCAYCLSRFLNGALQRAEGTQTCQRARGHFWKEMFVAKKSGGSTAHLNFGPFKVTPIVLKCWSWSFFAIEWRIFCHLNIQVFTCKYSNVFIELNGWPSILFVCAGSIHRHTTMRLVSLSEIFSITGRPRSFLVDLLLKRKTLKKKLI